MSRAKGVKPFLADCESNMIADIIVGFSLLDDALCIYALGHPNPNKVQSEMIEKIKKDPISVGMGDKIQFFVDNFPNLPMPEGGNKLMNLKGSLVEMKNIRNEIAHSSRFFFGSKFYVDVLYGKKRYDREQKPVQELHKKFMLNLSKFSELLTIIYSDWEYKNQFLYGYNK